MPEHYANVLQVLIGQMAERRDTNSVFSKALRIPSSLACSRRTQ
jgi:hypothetical protein